MKKMLVTLIFSMVFSISATAQAKLTANTLTMKASKKGQKATPKILSFLVGNWVGKGLGGEVRETWQRTGTGDLMGMFLMSKERQAKLL